MKPLYPLILALLAGCAAVPEDPYCVVDDDQGRPVILFKPTREQSRAFDNSHTNAKPVPVFPVTPR